jgi:sulfite reductase alpha subunit-like flavoprotein
VFVVSSTGEGDPPENFEEFWSVLHDKPPENMTYALLGLGDSNYTDFGGFPNTLREFLDGSGSRSFYEFQVGYFSLQKNVTYRIKSVDLTELVEFN